MTSNIYPEVEIQLLTASHELEGFSCGDESLDDWLRDRALKNQKLSATRTFAVTVKGESEVIGYYGLSMSKILRADAPKSTQRNMPDHIPVILLGRLAIDEAWQGKGLGRYLTRHMIKTSLAASQAVAARMIVTKPIDENAFQFYQSVGFESLKGQELLLAIDLKKIANYQ